MANYGTAPADALEICCRCCGQTKPANEANFKRTRRTRDWHAVCRPCFWREAAAARRGCR